MGVGRCHGALTALFMKTKHITIAIVAGAPVAKIFLPAIRRSTVVIGVDRGALYLLRNNIIPDVALGDFDSVTARERVRIQKHAKKVLLYRRKKDVTDLELATRYALGTQAGLVTIYGALGQRIDHELAAIFLLKQFLDAGISTSIVDDHNSIQLAQDTVVLQKDRNLPYVSVLPISHRAEVSLQGFLYGGNRMRLMRAKTRGISNEIRGAEAVVIVHFGLVCIVRSRDAA